MEKHDSLNKSSQSESHHVSDTSSAPALSQPTTGVENLSLSQKASAEQPLQAAGVGAPNASVANTSLLPAHKQSVSEVGTEGPSYSTKFASPASFETTNEAPRTNENLGSYTGPKEAHAAVAATFPPSGLHNTGAHGHTNSQAPAIATTTTATGHATPSATAAFAEQLTTHHNPGFDTAAGHLASHHQALGGSTTPAGHATVQTVTPGGVAIAEAPQNRATLAAAENAGKALDSALGAGGGTPAPAAIAPGAAARGFNQAPVDHSSIVAAGAAHQALGEAMGAVPAASVGIPQPMESVVTTPATVQTHHV